MWKLITSFALLVFLIVPFLAGSQVLQNDLQKKLKQHLKSYGNKSHLGKANRDLEEVRATMLYFNLTGSGVILTALGLLAFVMNDFNSALSGLLTRTARLVSDEIPSKGAREIHEIKALNQRFQLISQKLICSERRKQDLLDRLASEIHAPLTSILKDIRELTERGSTAEVLELILRVEYGTKALIGSIEGLLELSDLESGNLELQKERTSLFRLCNDSIQIVSRQALHKGVKVETLQRGLPDSFHINADSKKLERVIVNLLDHAIDLVPPNSGLQIELRSTRDCIELKSNWQIFVENRSEPAADNDIVRMSKIPLECTKSDGSLRTLSRANLTLLYCKMIVEAHGGIFSFNHKPEEQHIFQIMLPLNKDFISPRHSFQPSSID